MTEARAATAGKARTGARGTTSVVRRPLGGPPCRAGRGPSTREGVGAMKLLRSLMGPLCIAAILAGCVTQSVRNDPLSDLLQEVGTSGKVLLFGTVSGDVNAFALETSDGRRYEVSQLTKDSGLRLFYFLDGPRDFVIRGISTESGKDTYVLKTSVPVRWRGVVADGWINSSSVYLGRIDLRFTPKGSRVVQGRIDMAREREDRGLLQEALARALSVPRSALPPAGQAPRINP
jgi:hypothetical protein